MTAISERPGQEATGPDLRTSGLARMDEPMIDQPLAGDRVNQSSDLPRDNIVPSLAKPAPALLGEIQTVQERDPSSFTKEEFDTLNFAMQDRVSISLMRDISWDILQYGMRDGEERSESQLQLERLRRDFELKYPLSDAERRSFSVFYRYENGESTTSDEDMLDAIGEWIEILDGDRNDRQKGKRQFPRPKISGFKLARYDRFLLEEQIRQEREKADKLDAHSSVDELPRAA